MISTAKITSIRSVVTAGAGVRVTVGTGIIIKSISMIGKRIVGMGIILGHHLDHLNLKIKGGRTVGKEDWVIKIKWNKRGKRRKKSGRKSVRKSLQIDQKSHMNWRFCPHHQVRIVWWRW
jgi:hypothetical protein